MSHPESSTKARSIMDIAKESLATISVMASSKTSLTTTAGSSKGHSDRPPMRISSSETLTPDKKSKDCSKCVAKGKTCINECPRAKVENGLEAVNNTNNTMKIDIGIQFPEGILKRSCCLINEPCASGCPKRKGGQGPDSETKINRYLNWSEEISFPDEFKGFNRCISGKCVSGCSKSKGNQKPTTPQKDDDEVFDKKNVTPDETSMPNRDKCPRCGLKQCTSNCPRFQSENPPKKAAPIPSENAQEAANEIFTIYDQLDNQIISLDDIERISTTNEKDNEEPRLDEQEDENKTEIEPTPSENKSQQVDVEEIVRPDDDDPKLDNNICVTCVTRSQQCKKSCPNFYFDITMDVAPSRMIPSNGNEQFPNVSAPIDDIIKKCPKCSGRGACRSYCPNLTRKSDVVIKISSQVSMARDIHDVIDEINSMFDEPDYDTPQCLKCNSSFKMCTKSCPNINKQQHVTEDQDTAGPTPMSTIDINLSTNGGAMTLCTKCSRSRTTCSNDCPRHKQNKDV